MNEDVARIIGCTDEGSLHLPMWYRADGSYVEPGALIYTPDDLVAWLEKECPDDWAFIWDGEQFCGFALWNQHPIDDQGDGGRWEICVEDATILGCFEQLVLKIAAS